MVWTVFLGAQMVWQIVSGEECAATMASARIFRQWRRLTNREEATVSQSVSRHAAAFESTNEDPAESGAEAEAE